VWVSATHIHKKRDAYYHLSEYINKEVTPTALSHHRKELRRTKMQRDIDKAERRIKEAEEMLQLALERQQLVVSKNKI